MLRLFLSMSVKFGCLFVRLHSRFAKLCKSEEDDSENLPLSALAMSSPLAFLL
jgi:hypothetical protein